MLCNTCSSINSPTLCLRTLTLHLSVKPSSSTTSIWVMGNWLASLGTHPTLVESTEIYNKGRSSLIFPWIERLLRTRVQIVTIEHDQGPQCMAIYAISTSFTEFRSQFQHIHKFETKFYVLSYVKEKINMWVCICTWAFAYMWLWWLRYYVCICIHKHPSCIFEPKISRLLGHSINLIHALENLGRVTFDTIRQNESM